MIRLITIVVLIAILTTAHNSSGACIKNSQIIIKDTTSPCTGILLSNVYANKLNMYRLKVPKLEKLVDVQKEEISLYEKGKKINLERIETLEKRSETKFLDKTLYFFLGVGVTAFIVDRVN